MTFEPDDYNADIHEPDATGFPDGEGEVVEADYFVEKIVHTGAAARERANEWDEAIREAARDAAEELDMMGIPPEDELAEKAYRAIIYKLQWIAKTGQGTRDIV